MARPTPSDLRAAAANQARLSSYVDEPEDYDRVRAFAGGIIPRRKVTRRYLTRLRERCQRRYHKWMVRGEPSDMRKYTAAAVVFEEALDRYVAQTINGG